MAQRGRPPFEITPEVLEKSETLAAQGLTKIQIAQVLGIHIATLHKKVADNSDLNDAIKKGQAKGIAVVTNELMKSARAGNTTAQIFFLTNRDPENWRDRRYIQQNITTSKEIDPQIKRDMTAQQAAESYAETLKRGKGGNVIPLKQRR